MFLSILILLGFVSLLLDGFVYWRLRRRYPGKTGCRRIFVATAFIVYALIVFSLAAYRLGGREHTGPFSFGTMWAVWLLFINVYPKLIYVIVSSIDYPVGRLRRKKTRWFDKAGWVVGVFALGVMLWGSTGGRNCLRVVEVEIPSDRIPAEFDGFRIALIADLHLGNFFWNNTLIQRTVKRVNALDPDMVVVAGDVVHRWVRDLTPEYRQDLAELHGRCGVYSVVGNHDLGFYMRETAGMTPEESVRELAAAENEMGWRMLLNETELLARNGDTISVSGMRYPLGTLHRGRDNGLVGADPVKTYDGIPDYFNILINHTPENWDDILRETPADLTLAGHVHAMQFKYKIGKGRGWSPAAWLHPRWSGLYEENGRFLYINDGIGYVMLPMRIGCRPEITVLTLRATKRP